MRLIYHPDQKDLSLASVLYALGDPVRLEIVQQLSRQGDQPCCLLSKTAIAKSTLSHHFKVLRESGVIYSRKEGTQLINSLRREDLEVRFPGLLDAVLRAIEAEATWNSPERV
ncbi:MAG: metalloregulator ArsR/SmtB family transcription factor [Oculatellaceae cyanobacterium Prado106]|jgi:DNA-binding transcriptional ArsR family regulator|nr:metalloregulator ArsR/SmtB family transcription factor [Oculatellaceae cyanobacterium Prado106]